MNSQKVDFRERVIEIKNLGEVINDLLRVFQRESALLRQAPSGINPDWQFAPSFVFAVGEVFNILEISAGPRQKLQKRRQPHGTRGNFAVAQTHICTHLGNSHEGDCFEPVTQRL